ncbi:DUF4942 domain-containing protein [Salmonella enterica subsp. enterica serovar Infantis]|nr:DUF4942 domain-containing protein [Salmonella enterica subsp. enterica serovar Infantis]
MNQTLPTADLNTAGTTDVIPSVAIDRIIAQRNEGIALFMQAMECLATARRILLDASGDIFLYGFEDCVTDSVRCMDKPEEAKRNITRLADRKIWDRLMTDTGMYTFMSSCQRDEWNSQLMSDTCPEITLDNVLGKRLVRTVLIFTESSDQLSRATDRVPGLPASPGYVQ